MLLSTKWIQKFTDASLEGEPLRPTHGVLPADHVRGGVTPGRTADSTVLPADHVIETVTPGRTGTDPIGQYASCNLQMQLT